MDSHFSGLSIRRRAGLVGALVVVLTLVVGWQQRDRWRGQLRPDLIVSGSMAPALRGPHYIQRCVDCGDSIVAGVEFTDVSQPVVCGNCGFRQAWDRQVVVRPGDRAWIDTGAALRRWDTYAYLNDVGTWEVKRLIGRPGERVTIVSGDLFVDGRRLKKSPTDLRKVMIVVHRERSGDHDRQHHSATNRHRWVGEPRDRSPWEPTERGWRVSTVGAKYMAPCGTGAAEQGEGALVYHHFRGYESPLPRNAATVVQDDYRYNAGLSRPLRDVHDYGVACRLDWEGDARLVVECVGTWGVGKLCLRRRASGRCDVRVSHGDRFLQKAVFAADSGPLLFGRCDGRLVWEVDGTAGALELDPRLLDSARRDAAQRPFRARAAGSIELSNLIVWRDVHYYLPPGTHLPKRLGRNHWLLLGDNTPVSLDGRYSERGVAEAAVLGRVNIWPRVP